MVVCRGEKGTVKIRNPCVTKANYPDRTKSVTAIIFAKKRNAILK